VRRLLCLRMGQPQPQFDTTVDSGAFLSVFIPFMIIGLAFAVFSIVAMWRIFTKAGKPGWAAIVPFYNTYVLLKVVGRPGWWLVLLFVPLVNFVIVILVLVDLAKAFGKSGGFAVLLIFLQPIGMGILAFSGNAVYRGPLADPNFAAQQYQQQYQQPQYPPPGYPPQQGGAWR
jgi:hypothetical protein